MDFVSILEKTMQGYCAQGFNGYTYLTINEDRTRFVVTAISEDDRAKSFLNLAVHLESGYIVIYHDANSKPLVDALVQNGISRNKVVLLYLGEKIPDIISQFKEILRGTLSIYAGEGLNSHAYLMSNADETAFAVIASASVRGKPVVNTGILARIESGLIIIERDMNDKQVVDALIQNGVPREKIILAYAGETIASTE